MSKSYLAGSIKARWGQWRSSNSSGGAATDLCRPVLLTRLLIFRLRTRKPLRMGLWISCVTKLHVHFFDRAWGGIFTLVSLSQSATSE